MSEIKKHSANRAKKERYFSFTFYDFPDTTLASIIMSKQLPQRTTFYSGYTEINPPLSATVLTIGNFDGLHIGHRQILQAVIDDAKKLNCATAVYTFRPHPHMALRSDLKVDLINSYNEKLQMLEDLGIDVVIEQPFNRDFSTLSPEAFFNEVVIKKLNTRALHVGYDFGFGKNRQGNTDFLIQQCNRSAISLIQHPPYRVQNADQSLICSSTEIRRNLLTGSLQTANLLLGRRFFYEGNVVKGNQRGRTIGFPTANIRDIEKINIRFGVYASFCIIDGVPHKSITNVGRAPTFNSDENPFLIETHIFDFNKDIYGARVRVEFVDFIRDEKKFPSVESLVGQIHQDVLQAKSRLGL